MIVVSWRISWERTGHDPVKNGDLTKIFTGKSWICGYGSKLGTPIIGWLILN